MTICTHTGISVPECSCRACLQALIERHMPSQLAAQGPEAALAGSAAGTESPVEGRAVANAASPRESDPTAIAAAPGRAGMLRRLRQSRLRRTA